MPLRYRQRYETVDDIERNYCNEGHYVMPPGITSPGKALRLEAAREREARLEYEEYVRRTTPWYMNFNIDMNNEHDVRSTMELLQMRLKQLENDPIFIPDPKYY